MSHLCVFRDVPVGSASSNRDSGRRYYEINSRLSDAAAAGLVTIDRYGQIYLNWSPTCHQLPVTVVVSSWATDDRCAGLDYLMQPLVLDRRRCRGGGETSVASVAYYGLACNSNRTEWCQREYKKDVAWPREVEDRCLVERTGLEKARCYMAGKLEISYRVKCETASLNVTYHLLQSDQPVKRQSHTRIRRALAVKPPFFKRPQYSVNVKEEGSKQHLVTSIQALNPEGGSLRYSMVSLIDSRSQDLFSIDPVTAAITTNDKLDREFMDVHYFRVVAVTADRPPLTATTTVQVIPL